MLFYTVGQSKIFLTMLYAGLVVGAYVSIDSALRRLFDAGIILSLVMDLLLGTVTAFIIIPALLLAADGELRLYSLMGVLCGFLIYSGTLQPLLTHIMRHLMRVLRFIGKWLGQRTLIKKLLK